MPYPLATPVPLLNKPFPAGTLPTITVDVTNVGVFTIDVRGATGTLILQSVDGAGLNATALSYALSAGGPTTNGTLTFVGGERIYCSPGCSTVKITGTVTSGALSLTYVGYLSVPPGAAVPVGLVLPDGSVVNGVTPLPVMAL